MLDFFKKALLLILIAFRATCQDGLSGNSVSNQENIPVLSRIIINNDSILNPLSLKSDSLVVYSGNISLKRTKSCIVFEISSDQNTEFQFLLKGFDSKWSNWQKYNYKEYTNQRVNLL